MPKYSVQEVLDIIKNLTPVEKAELQQLLPVVLESSEVSRMMPGGADLQQQQISGVSISGSVGVELHQIAADRSSTIAQTDTQATLHSADLEAAIATLGQLRDAIAHTPDLTPAEKKTTQESIETLETELNQPQPNKNLVEQTIELLKQGLSGVAVLADPVKKVADLIAKAWIPG